MKNSILLIALTVFLIIPQIGYSFVKITYKGKIYYFDEIPSCYHIVSMPEGAKCDDLAITNNGNGGNGTLFTKGWKKRMQRALENPTPLRKIKKARIKLIKGERKAYFKKWFLGKRIYLGTIKE